MKPFRWAFAVVLGLTLAASACGPRQSQPMTAFEGKLADWSREILADSPETASQTGVQEDAAGGVYSDRLDDRSSIAAEARRSAAVRRYAELRALDVSVLSPEDRLTYNVLRDQFANAAAGAAFTYGDFSPLGGIRPYGHANGLQFPGIVTVVLFDQREQNRLLATPRLIPQGNGDFAPHHGQR